MRRCIETRRRNHGEEIVRILALAPLQVVFTVAQHRLEIRPAGGEQLTVGGRSDLRQRLKDLLRAQEVLQRQRLFVTIY